MGSQFSIPVFLKFDFRISGGLKFREPVEDSGNGGPSSTTVRIEYLLTFQY